MACILNGNDWCDTVEPVFLHRLNFSNMHLGANGKWQMVVYQIVLFCGSLLQMPHGVVEKSINATYQSALFQLLTVSMHINHTLSPPNT